VRFARGPALPTVGSDVAAADIQDGYTGTSSKTRPAVTFTLGGSSKPLFLADDGTKGYGTLFGVVVGGTAGSNGIRSKFNGSRGR